ncbi:MAG: ATP-binding protein [Deltaproteobacteria bacterium]|nr:ATP-binding protein [Deltaproteobacteria bacterium]
MIIAVASGKGGTGKTTVAVSLALSLNSVQFADCDVEEPNAAIFLRPVIDEKIPVTMLVPEIDETKCSGCNKCSELCAYNALVVIGTRVLVFPNMCHGCGGCTLICPERAITEKPREIGVIEKGSARAMAFMQGILNVGDPMATPIIRELHHCLDRTKTIILDSPPGTSCPVIETVRDSDYCILVTEPTPFGLHDLQLAVETVRQLKVPFGVIVNSAGIGDEEVDKYCQREAIPLLMKIPWDRRIAEGYSRGEPIMAVMPELRQGFLNLHAAIAATCGAA